MEMRIEIGAARESELAAIVTIYNEVLTSSTAIFSDVPVTLDERTRWWGARLAQDYPVLVARDASGVLGFASFGDFRAWSGYRFTVEHSVHVRAEARGRGAGSALVRALIGRAAALGKHAMIGGVDAGNAASIRFHERLGFEKGGELREVGYKFGRWLDLVFLQRRI